MVLCPPPAVKEGAQSQLSDPAMGLKRSMTSSSQSPLLANPLRWALAKDKKDCKEFYELSEYPKGSMTGEKYEPGGRTSRPVYFYKVGFRMLFGNKNNSIEWLVVCLGNVGDKYDNTRHNVGFEVADELAERKNIPLQKLKHRALTNTAELGGKKALIMKPVTYMNLSGEAAGEAARFYKVPPERVLVVCDDISLPPGKLRLRSGGSAGGHNGLKSLIQHLGTDQFPRVKIGVGQKPHPDYDLADWVLGKFQGEDRKVMDQTVKKAADAVECLLRDGMDKAMSRFN